MEYKLRYNEDELVLEIATEDGGRFKAAIGDNRYAAAFQRISDNCLHLTVNGRQTMAFVTDTTAGKAVTIKGRTWLLEDESTRGSRGSRGPKSGPKAVTPPMPAVVTRILVSAGETVEKGQGLLVVSAMKMDTTLTAPFDGVITRINCAEGDKVTPQQVLVDIEATNAA